MLRAWRLTVELLENRDLLHGSPWVGLPFAGDFVRNPANGHYYGLTAIRETWDQADADAVARGGYLASITSQAEQDFLINTFVAGLSEKQPLWIGLRDVNRSPTPSNRNFRWTTGEPVTYSAWHAGEPNNNGGNEWYTAFNYHHGIGQSDTVGTWNDTPNSGSGGPYRGIIELEFDPTASLTQGLLAYWSFDGEGADSSGAGRNLTVVSGTSFAPGLHGLSLDLHHERSRFAERSDDDVFDFGSGDFTIQSWVNFHDTAGEQVLIEKFVGAGGPGWTLTKLSGNQLQFWAAPSVTMTSAALTIPANTWHHIAVRKSGQLFTLYFDGVRVATDSDPLDVPLNSAPLLIGKRNDTDPRDLSVNGRLDEFAIWGRALAEQELTTLYNGGAGLSLDPTPLSSPARFDLSGGNLLASWSTGLTISLDQGVGSFAPGPDGSVWYLRTNRQLMSWSANGGFRAIEDNVDEFQAAADGAIYYYRRSSGAGNELTRFDPETSAYTFVGDRIDSYRAAADGSIYYFRQTFNSQGRVLFHRSLRGVVSQLEDLIDSYQVGGNAVFYYRIPSGQGKELTRWQGGQGHFVGSGIDTYQAASDGSVYYFRQTFNGQGSVVFHGSATGVNTQLEDMVESYQVAGSAVYYYRRASGQGKELTRWQGGQGRFVGSGIDTYQAAGDGSVYYLRQSFNGQTNVLFRWSVEHQQEQLDTDVTSYQPAADGTVYFLKSTGDLRRRRPGESSTLLANQVSGFEVRSYGTVWLQRTDGSTQVTFEQGDQLPHVADDFSRVLPGGRLSRYWTPLTGIFNVSSSAGNRLVTGGPGDNFAALSLGPPPSLTNPVPEARDVAVQTRVAGLASGQYMGLMARYHGPGLANFYLAMLYRVGNTARAVIYRNFGGAWAAISADTALGDADALVVGKTLRFEVVGSSQKLYIVDGSGGEHLLASANDNLLAPGGGAGLRLVGGATVEDFTVNRLAPRGGVLGVPYTFDSPGGRLSRDWNEKVGSFSVAGGSAIGNGVDAYAVLNLVSGLGVSENVGVQATVQSLGAGQYVGLSARDQGPGYNQFYMALVYGTGSSRRAVIYRNYLGHWAAIGADTLVTVAGDDLRFEVVGSSQKLFVSGVLVVFANDSLVTGQGYVGMRSVNGAALASFRADAIAAPAVTLPYSVSGDWDADPEDAGLPVGQLGREWEEKVGNFRVNEGSSTAAGAGVDAYAVLRGVSERDVAVEAVVGILAPGQYIGLSARDSGDGYSNFYMALVYNTGGAVRAVLYRNFQGAWAAISTDVVLGSAADLRGNRLRFEVVGSSQKLSLVGATLDRLVTFANDGVISTAGTVGLRSVYGASLDSFTASRVDLLTATLPFTENWNVAPSGTQLDRRWTEHAGSFTVANVAGSQAITGSSGDNFVVLNGLTVGDVAVELDATNLDPGEYVGLVARHGGPGYSNFYVALVYNSGGTRRAVIYRNFNGAWAAISADVVVSTAGRLRFEAAGSILRLKVGADGNGNGGSLVLVAHDTLLRTGSVGVRAFGAASVDIFRAVTL